MSRQGNLSSLLWCCEEKCRQLLLSLTLFGEVEMKSTKLAASYQFSSDIRGYKYVAVENPHWENKIQLTSKLMWPLGSLLAQPSFRK